eukprot:1917557-Pyramimonas_sp.AAC.1
MVVTRGRRGRRGCSAKGCSPALGTRWATLLRRSWRSRGHTHHTLHHLPGRPRVLRGVGKRRVDHPDLLAVRLHGGLGRRHVGLQLLDDGVLRQLRAPSLLRVLGRG